MCREGRWTTLGLREWGPSVFCLSKWPRDEQIAISFVHGRVLDIGCGAGRHALFHTTKILRLPEDLPIVVEIVDALDKIEAFL